MPQLCVISAKTISDGIQGKSGEDREQTHIKHQRFSLA